MVALPQLAQIPLSSFKGVGPGISEKLAKIHLFTAEDILFHLPLRYEDRTRVTAIRDLVAGIHTNIVGSVTGNQVLNGKRRMLLVTIQDGSGTVALRFFHFSAAQKNNLSVGTQIRCYGEIQRGARSFEIIHPEYKLINQQTEQMPVEESLTPVYPTTDGLRQASIRHITEQALHQLKKATVEELLPASFIEQGLSLKQALQIIHRPTPDISTSLLESARHPAQLRLIKEELIAHNLSMLALRNHSNLHKARAIKPNTPLLNQFLSMLPFSPTQAQKRVVAEIQQDLAKSQPMMRLVQGDVGSGKTLVAALSALSVIGQGFQVALMAPTEILAEQHALTFQQWFSALNITVAWLAGKTKAKQKRETLAKLADGSIQLIVGTHALFQTDVQFNCLSLIIIDEQHRFGVHQRLALREKGAADDTFPHQLIMTATPIPRTLAMTAYADLDTSIIDELPPGRTPVTTVAIPDSRRDDIIQRIHTVCEQENRQAYWVCTLIEESEVLECQAAEDTALYLQETLSGLNVGLVHGRMKPAEKQAVMEKFKQGDLHLLVATTVIEVGVDVPNASLMIIENPERLGLAQLHQLRGRVGRGATASHCVLMYKSPLSKTATKRLGVLRDSNDGFYIAQKDLEIRGPGEVLGTKQTGLAEMKIADLSRDGDLIPEIQQQAYLLAKQHPNLVKPLIKRWLPNKQQYVNA